MTLNLTNQRFGRLTARYPTNTLKGRRWHCDCDCGGSTLVTTVVLTRGASKSCGCLRREQGAATGHAGARHGEGSNGKETPEYRAWCQLRNRCTNPNHRQFPAYGGRGITVCERWQDYELFLADMGRRPSPHHSIDRRDNNRGYEPSNCRWATRLEQNRNTRSTRRVTVDGVTQSLSEWLEQTGVDRRTFYNRLNRGMSEVAALGLATTAAPPDFDAIFD